MLILHPYLFHGFLNIKRLFDISLVNDCRCLEFNSAFKLLLLFILCHCSCETVVLCEYHIPPSFRVSPFLLSLSFDYF